MIHIDPEKSVSPIVDRKKVESQQKTGKNAFQNFFQQAVGSAKTEESQIESTPFISEIRPVQFETQTAPSTNLIVDRVGHLIDSMEAYQQKLIENGATLKDIEPFIDKLASQSDSLSAISNDSGMEDDLKSIVNQSLLLSSKEIARYKSGQYNDE
jgi:hypothetical protein